MLNRIIPLVICTIVGAAVAGVLVSQSSNQKQQATLDEQKQAFRKEAQQGKGAREHAPNLSQHCDGLGGVQELE